MKIDLECGCGASMHCLIDGNADEATVNSVAVWIRIHSLHGEKLVGKVVDANQKIQPSKRKKKSG